jgi:hypothetical protein
MPALFLFLFKVNVALVLFCLGYYLVLRHLTFYTLNRVYLVAAILFSTVYPNINLTDFAQRHQQLTEPVQSVILNWKAPAEKLVKPLYQPNYWQWVELIFWAGVALFAARLIMQLFSLYKIYSQSKPGQVHDHNVRLIPSDIGPFSFWRSIYINPAKLSPAELKSVLEHEQVHVNEWHTLDILLAELSTIFYWFNPGVWLMKKAVRENIEFITDRKILRKGMDSKEYQYSLVSISLATTPNTIVSHFNMSTIKKRIIMMNTKKSSGYTLTRYVFLVPAVIALLLVFSLSKAEISKKGISTVKYFANNIITSASLISTQPHINPVKENAAKHKTIKTVVKPVDTIYNGKSKTGRKSFMVVTSGRDKDSTTLLINGVPSTLEQVKALDPDNVKSVDMMSAKNAKEFYHGGEQLKPHVLFVTTEDSETGKEIKRNIDKSFRSGDLARAHNMAYSVDSDSDDNAPAVAGGSGYSYSVHSSESSDDAPVAIRSGGKNVSTAVVVSTDVNNAVSVDKVNKVYINKAPKATVYVRSSDSVDPEIYVVGKPREDTDDKTPRVYIDKHIDNDETIINNSGNELIIVDGKEAKKMDNINPHSIKSIIVLNGKSATSTYGAKGKNGVIVIKTKKNPF